MTTFIESEIDFDKEEIKIVDDKKYVTFYKRNDEGTIFKHTKIYKIEIKKTMLSKKVADRRTWSKFGASKGLPPGPDTASTNRVVEEVFFEFTNKNKIADDSDEPNTLLNTTNQNVVKCKHCGGNHWSIKCNYKSEIDKPKPDSTTTKYVPKFKRDGIDPTVNRNRNTIKVSNISENATEEDIRDLFSGFGRITKLYYTQRGFSYISYSMLDACEKAIENVNGHPYDYLILSVEIAK